MSKVVLVGAGPGDPALLTVKAKQYIEQADCIVYDRLVGDEIIALARADCEMIYVGKENHHHAMKQEDIQALLVEKSKEYALVVRLKGGDPYVFGRGGEEALYLQGQETERKAGINSEINSETKSEIKIEVVPGISSSVAALAYAGIPITHRGLAQGFHVITAHTKKDVMADIRFDLLTDDTETLVFLMGLAHVAEIAQELIQAGRDPQTMVAVISNGTTNRQKKCVGTLETIGDLVTAASLVSPAIIVVGAVVGLEKQLSFFEQRPLFGRTFFVPYIEGGSFTFADGWKTEKESRLAKQLREQGAEVITCQTGSIRPMPCNFRLLRDLTERDYLVFTSRQAVCAFCWNLREQKKDLRILGNARLAVVGQKTAQALRDFGLTPDLIAEKQTGEGLGELLAGQVDPYSKVIWLCADRTGNGLEQALAGKCELLKVVCYENVSGQTEWSQDELEQITGCDGVFFTSASNVERTIQMVGTGLPKRIYSIGKACSEKLRSMGITDYVEAAEPSYESLITACVDIG